MHASRGDMLIVRGTKHGQPDRKGEVIEARGADGGPPFLVRWDDADHATLFFPGSDCVIESASGDAQPA